MWNYPKLIFTVNNSNLLTARRISFHLLCFSQLIPVLLRFIDVHVEITYDIFEHIRKIKRFHLLLIYLILLIVNFIGYEKCNIISRYRLSKENNIFESLRSSFKLLNWESIFSQVLNNWVVKIWGHYWLSVYYPQIVVVWTANYCVCVSFI
jgi:hypothetical protein